jgi:N-acyl amino acid synthase of PEP-CTERM/exosortase system
MNELYESFQKYFEVVIADTNELLEHAYRIRYQIFCLEHGFLDASHYPDQLEKDDFDDHSSHILLRLRSSGDFIGTVRLIMLDPVHPEKLFPIELYGQLDSDLFDIKALQRQRTAEISRFVIMSKFQRRRGDRVDRRVKNSDNPAIAERRSAERCDRRAAPPLVLLLAAGVVRLSTMYKIDNWLSIMDPALNRLLGYYGLELNPIGPCVNYHGLRQSYYARVEDVLDRMYKKHHAAWEVVTDCGKYNP